MTSSGAVPRWSSPRRADRATWGPRVAKVAEALGKPLLPWQMDAANRALEVDPRTGLLVYRQVVITVPRQSGKSTLTFAKNVQRMIDAASFGGRQRLTYTAQSRNDARKKLVDDWAEDLKGARRFNGRWSLRLSPGQEAIRWENGSLWGIQANTEKAGHGATLDVGDIDEAFSHTDDRTEQAMSPAMVTRKNAQLWIVSTAGTDRSTYLRAKVDAGRALAEDGADTGVCYIEYSADPADDPEDPATWARCMPALGFTVDVDTIRAELQKMGLAGFSRAYLNLWVPAGFGQQVIPADEWDACADEGSEIDGDGVVFAVDVAPGSAWASIAVAGHRADGLPHVEVIEHGPGDGWVAARVGELQARWGARPIVLDPAGPAGGILAQLLGQDRPVVAVSARQMTQACGALKSGARDGAFRHLGQELLTDALAGAATRQLMDAWAFRRTSSSCDISPLVAAALALWGLSTVPVPRSFSDEELLRSVG